MKQAKFLLLTLLAILGYGRASADYSVDFNTAITTSNHDFAVASNWGHIVDYLEYDYYGAEYVYVTYTYGSTSGTDGSGALGAYSQNLQASYGQSASKTAYDLLVTPLISGTITIDVKAMNYDDASLEVYALTDNGTVKGDLIKSVSSSELSKDNYTTVSFDLSTEQRVGLRLNRVYLDNFTASSATILPEPKLTVNSVTKATNESTVYYKQQADGSLLVQMYVTLKNDGEVDFIAGQTENYTLSVLQDYYGDKHGPYGCFAIPVDLAVGETSDNILVEVNVPSSEYSSLRTWGNWYVIENVTSTQSNGYVYAGLTAYEPKFAFREAGSTSSISSGSAQNWGTITESTTKNYEIYNDGTAPLIVNSIAIPEGFTSSVTSETNTSVKYIANGSAADGAVFYAWTWGDGVANHWVPCNADGVFEDLAENFLIARINPNDTPSDMSSWGGDVWNQTDNLTLDGGGWVFDNYDNGRMKGHFVAAVVESKAAKAIDITQDAATTGTFSGNLTIKYLNASNTEVTYELPISTTVIGANTWSWDFNNSTSTPLYPAGSVLEGGIDKDYQYISSGNYNDWIIGRTGSSYATDDNKFITPLLHAETGDQLAFDVKGAYGSNFFAKVYVSTDRKTWTLKDTYTYDQIGSTWVTKSITFDTAGDYYVAFALYGKFGIDNLVGLELVEVTHDIYIKEVTWPHETGKYIKSGVAQTKPTVKIIPLTNETADAYTVKYIYGDNVVNGTSKALTASNSSTTDFSFNYTPEVESTTTFENTKVVFEFQDGTTFETELFDLTVSNEPIFHFLSSKYTSRWYEPSSDYTTPIDFGKINESATKSFYILNWGSAPLEVTGISVPEGFTVSKDQMTIAAFDGTQDGLNTCQESFDLTFNAGTAGTYSGDMVITYIDGTGTEATFTIAVSGTWLDSSKWYANFGSSSNQWPAGSTYQSNVSTTYVNTGDYAITSQSTTNNLFITPKLSAEAGETLTFDAKLYDNSSWSGGQVKVYAAATRDELLDTEVEKTPVFTTSDMTTDYQTFTVPIPDAGEYYLGFEISNRPYVDEIYGLTLAEAGLDLAIVSSNIPTEGMQNKPVTATVNVNNYGLTKVAGEDYKVMVGIGDIKSTAEQGTVELPMTPALSAAGTAISVSFLSPKAGTYPVTIAITDNEGNILTKTEPVNVTFAEEEASSEIVVGTQRSGSASRDYAIIDFYNLDNYALTSDILYTAAQLEEFGVIAGTKITAITFKGTISSAKTISNSLTAWVGTSTGEITYNSPDKSAMQEVTIYDGTMAFVSGENDIVVTLPQPIVYDGSSDLRVYFEGTKGGWASLSFNYDSKYSNMKWSNASSMKYNPLAYLSIEATIPTIAGTVTDADNQPIANATVTLVSADSDQVQYEGTTDDDGNYSISVIQSTRTYDATVSAEGYDDEVAEDVSFEEAVDGVLTKDFTLTQTPEFVEVTIGVRGAASFSSKYPLDFSSTDVTAYIITGKEGTIFTRQAVTEVPANTGILVYAAQGTYQISVAADEPEDIDNNLLVATSKGEYTVTEEDYGRVYGLFYSTKQQKMGFQKKSVGYTFGVDKCYLLLPEGANANELFFDLDTLTGIDAIATDAADEKGDTFNLSGQKVNASYKGVIIRNGKKMIQK